VISAASNQRREWPAQLAKAQFIWPNQVSSRSKRANAAIITGGWLMKCPPHPETNMLPPPRPASSRRPNPIKPAPLPMEAANPRASKTAECRVTTSGRAPECRSRVCVCKERGLTLPQIYECEPRLHLHDSFSGLCLQTDPFTTSLTGSGERRRHCDGTDVSTGYERQEAELGRHTPPSLCLLSGTTSIRLLRPRSRLSSVERRGSNWRGVGLWIGNRTRPGPGHDSYPMTVALPVSTTQRALKHSRHCLATPRCPPKRQQAQAWEIPPPWAMGRFRRIAPFGNSQRIPGDPSAQISLCAPSSPGW
jgi:hypothetical protein